MILHNLSSFDNVSVLFKLSPLPYPRYYPQVKLGIVDIAGLTARFRLVPYVWQGAVMNAYWINLDWHSPGGFQYIAIAMDRNKYTRPVHIFSIYHIHQLQ